MYIEKLDEKLASRAYNILCQSLAPNQEMPLTPPFGMTYCIIEPDGHSDPHGHYDGEVFLILSGHGHMRIVQEEKEVTTGDVIFIPNHSNHELTNTSHAEPLKFISIYFDQPAFAKKFAPNYLIYSAPATPNGKLHVGHLSGPYLSADISRRYLTIRGASAIHCSGSDENQSYVPTKARQLKRPTESLQVAREYTEQILDILNRFSASPDLFLLPHADKKYKDFVTDFFNKLVQSKHLQLKVSDYPYCETCECFIHESNVSGQCPHCFKKTNGNGCEACGLYNDCRDLIEPVCNICGTICEKRKSERYVFSLAAHKEQLKKELSNKRLHPRIRLYVNRMLQEGLQEITVTYPYFWGIPVPDLPGQVIYEWMEMAAAYLYQAQQVKPDVGYEFFWKQPNNKTILAFGFDNCFFYLGLVPALMSSFDAEIKYPDSFLVNFFYLLDGKKFSTSRNHAIWGDEILTQIDADAIRLYLAGTRPEKSETNFTQAEFEKFLDTTGVKGWDALMLQISQLANLPTIDSKAGLTDEERAYLEYWQTLIHQCELAFDPEQLRLNTVIENLNAYRDSLLEFLQESLAEQAVDWRLVNAGLKGLAQILEPICPTYAKRIFTAIEYPEHWNALLDLAPMTTCPNNLPLDYFKLQLNKLGLPATEVKVE